MPLLTNYFKIEYDWNEILFPPFMLSLSPFLSFRFVSFLLTAYLPNPYMDTFCPFTKRCVFKVDLLSLLFFSHWFVRSFTRIFLSHNIHEIIGQDVCYTRYGKQTSSVKSNQRIYLYFTFYWIATHLHIMYSSFFCSLHFRRKL